MSAPPRDDSGARLDRLERRVRLSLGLNAALGASTLVLGWLMVTVLLAEPAEVAGVTDLDERRTAGDEEGDYRQEMRTFFLRMEDVLDREARRQGVNPADVLPTREQIDDAVETRTMHSDQSQLVLQKLREGFDMFDLTWPAAIPER
jgi:hypothetical protein